MALWPMARAAALAAASYPVLNGFVTTLRRFRALRLVKCPETGEPAVVQVDAVRAAINVTVAAENSVAISSCSLLRDDESCPQACAPLIEARPVITQIPAIVSEWYAGRTCFYCAREMGAITWRERPHALRRPDGTTVEWTEIPSETLPQALETHDPVCWPCHVLEWFRNEYDRDAGTARKRREQEADRPPAVY